MEWNVKMTKTFESWFDSLNEPEHQKVLEAIFLLKSVGPFLGRPTADTLEVPKKKKKLLLNLKELRVQHEGACYRCAFIFDPKRNAVLLCAGNKQGKAKKLFYDSLISSAENEYTEYLKGMESE